MGRERKRTVFIRKPETRNKNASSEEKAPVRASQCGGGKRPEVMMSDSRYYGIM